MFPQGRKKRSIFSAPPLRACVEIKIYGALVLNHRVVLHAIDATPARWRGDAGSSPSPRNDFVENYRCTRRTG